MQDQEGKRKKDDDQKNSEMSDTDLEKLIVVTQTRQRSHKLDPGVAKLINDGLAMYEQELAEMTGTKGRHPGRPPRAPSSGKAAAHAMHFYSSSLPKNIQNNNRSSHKR